jgi:hypothetical protein
MLIAWDSRNWPRLKKMVGLCKDYGLTALSKRVCIGNAKKNDLPGLQKKLLQLFRGKKDRFFLFMLCKSCMEVPSVPVAVQMKIVQPTQFEFAG